MRSGERALLVADIGGTKTDIVQVPIVEDALLGSEVTTLSNSEFDGAESVLDRFLADAGERPRFACIAVAGLVASGAARLTNLPWELDARRLAKRYSLDGAFLVNDVHALGCVVPRLQVADFTTLVPGAATPGGTMLVISPGTGLGMSFVVWAADRYRAFPSEGGNATFAPATSEQLEILRFTGAQLDVVRAEDLCSGPGIQRIYRFLQESGRYRVSGGDIRISALPDDIKTAEIVASATSGGTTELCRETLRLFVEILADVTRNSTLSLMATGGVYIAGSLPLRVRALLMGSFERAFTESVRSRALTLDMPVYLVTKPYPVLEGAFWYAMEKIGATE
jgi:glucokinase